MTVCKLLDICVLIPPGSLH